MRRVARAEARRHYFMRVVRRAVRARRTASTSVGQLVSDSPRSHDSRAVASPCAESPESGEAGDEQPLVARPDEDSSAPVPRGAGVLSVCPSLVAKAEVRAAPGLIEDFTTDGELRSPILWRGSTGLLLSQRSRRGHGRVPWILRTLAIWPSAPRGRGRVSSALSALFTSRSKTRRSAAFVRKRRSWASSSQPTHHNC